MTDKVRKRNIIFTCLVLLICGVSSAREIVVEPYSVYHVVVNDPGIISLVRSEQSLDPEMVIDSLEFIDATRNGFGEGDLMVVFPNKQVFPLLNVEGKLRSTMDSWLFRETHQLTSPITDSYEMERVADEVKKPKPLILSAILRSLERYYSGDQIEGYFRRDCQTSFLQLWNYDPEQLKFVKMSQEEGAKKLNSFDLLKIVVHDTVYVTDSTMFDAYYIMKTEQDTVYIPVK